MPEYIKTDGSNRFVDGYWPATQLDPANKAYVDQLFATYSAPEDEVIPPAFRTTSADLPNGEAGKSYFHQFYWVGNPAPIFEVSGYTGPGLTTSSKGALFIPSLVSGTYFMTAALRPVVDNETPGDIVDTVEWTLVVSEPEQLTDASINSSSLSPVVYGAAPKVPLDVAGSEPYTLSLEAGALPSGVALRVGALSRAQLLDTFVDGLPDIEGPGVSCTIGVTGATGVKATRVFASGIAVNRAPTFVGLNEIPQFPSNTPGAFDLAPFVKAYPAITGFTTSPVLTTLHPNLNTSGLTITYGDLTTIAGTQTEPILFTLDDNGIGTPDTFTGTINVGTSSVPVPKVLAAYDFSSYSAVNGSEITSVPDLAQGAALPLSTALVIAGTSGPLWDSVNKCAQMRSGKSIGLALDAGRYPFAIGLNAKFKSTTTAGTRDFMRATGTYAYFDKGAAGGSRPAFLSSEATTKGGGPRTSDPIFYTPASAISGLVVKVGHSTVSGDIISSITVSNGGAPVFMTRATQAADVTGELLRTYIYFLGAGIPTGALTITVNYASSTTALVYFVIEGYTATADLYVVNAPTAVQADTANPTITCDTTASNLDCLATAMLGSGAGTLANITDGGSQTRQHAFTATAGPQFDAVSRLLRTGTTDPATWTHTPVGTPKGVFIVCMNYQSDTNHVSSMTYGGVSATQAMVLPRASSANGCMTVYYLGSGIPTGAQTVSVDLSSATGDDMELMCVTITGSTNTEIIDSDSIDQASIANPSKTMQYGGRLAQTYGFIWHGADNLTDLTFGPELALIQAFDKGSASWVAYRQKDPNISDFTFSFTAATNACTAAFFAVAEVANGIGEATFIASRQTTGGTADFPFAWTIASDDVALCAITMSEIAGGAGAIMSVANNVLASSAAQSGVVDTQVRQILYCASATAGSYWKNGTKSALTPAGAGNIAGLLKNIIFHGQSCDWDLYKLEVWSGVLSDSDAAAMDTRLNTDRTPPTPNPPNPPTNIVASAGNTVVNLSWTPAPNAITTKIERSTTSGSGFAQIANESDATYQDTGRTNGQIYYYRFRSSGAGGDGAYSSEVSATPAPPIVGAPANHRITNVASGAVTHAWDSVSGATYKIYRGTSSGAYSEIATGITALNYTHSSLTNATTYFFAVKATVGGVDSAYSNEVTATPTAQTGITKNFPLLDGFMTADMLLSQHHADIRFEASGPTIQGRRINSPTTGGGSDTLGHLAEGFPFIKPITKMVPHLGATRKFFEMTIWHATGLTTFVYGRASGGTTIRATIATGPYDNRTAMGEQWFMAFAFMLDSSLTAEQANPLLGGADHGFCGLHSVNLPGAVLTPMSLFFDPTSSSALKLQIIVRSHPFDNAPPDTPDLEEHSAAIDNLVAGKYYELVYEYKLGYLNSMGGYARAWLWEDGVARNSGNPFLNYTGRVGFNRTNPNHQRRIMSHYLWRGAGQFDQISANNISGIPSGTKGLRYFMRKSINCAGGTSNGVTVTRDTILNYLRLVE